MTCPYHEDCEVCVCDTKHADALEAIRELNARCTSHLITMMNTVQRATLERDQARAALRRVQAENERLRAGVPALPSKPLPHEWKPRSFHTDECIHCGRRVTQGIMDQGVDAEICPQRTP